MKTEQYIISAGHCRSLGATIEKDGVNFAIWCPEASCMELLLFKSPEDTSPDVISLSSNIFKSDYYWHVKVMNIPEGQIYAWRIKSALRISAKHASNVVLNRVLLDPYSRRVIFPEYYSRFQGMDDEQNFRTSAKSAVVDMGKYEWGLDIHPAHALTRTIIYEMHVKGFTADPSSGISAPLRGTYRGLIEKIPYLLDLGITAVELMPIFQYDVLDAKPGMHNYWGYSPMSFFSPHEGYSSDKSLYGPLNEFRDMVRALHRQGIEVILDVVYNHTSEGDKFGPVYCFKGLDRKGYYILNQDESYANYSGCGNTFNGNNPVVRNLIMDSLIFWKEEMHVDGFRFDLASILARDTSGTPLANSPTLLDIDANRRLANTKIIAEPWDAGGLYQLGQISGAKWREWNGQFRDDVRSFMRGDNGVIKRFIQRLLGSPDIYNDPIVDPQKSINFITCHDGFTLWDLVCYAEKHNFDNGENNRDGNNTNYSANYGIEGETDDPHLNALRLRQVKNMMALTMLSMGTPMICMGDEVLRSQKGNNNAYCQDNPISWFNWNLSERSLEMLEFTKAVIRMRVRGHIQSMRRKSDAKNVKLLNNALRNSRLQWHGVRPFQPDWSDQSHSIGLMVFYGTFSVYAYLYVNAFWQDLTVELPPPPTNLHRHWYLILDTSKSHLEAVSTMLNKGRFRAGDKILIKARSLQMLICIAV